MFDLAVFDVELTFATTSVDVPKTAFLGGAMDDLFAPPIPVNWHVAYRFQKRSLVQTSAGLLSR
jgi:hypothetical protein